MSPAFLKFRGLAAAALVCQLLHSSASSNICQPGSLPYMDCEFDKGSNSKCIPGVNTGQVAQQANGICQPPSAYNGCHIQWDNSEKAWMFSSSNRGVTCCNCFQLRPVSPCPMNSLPYHICDFNGGGRDENACWPGVNTGAAAETNNGHCEPPSEQNGCLLDFDQSQRAWMWKSSHSQVTCCNCFQAKIATASSLLQQPGVKRHSRLRRAHSGEGDSASMLQLPAGVDGDMEDAELSADEFLSADEL